MPVGRQDSDMLEPFKIEYYRAGKIVALDTAVQPIATAQRTALLGMTTHKADQAKIFDGVAVVAVFSG
jgi:hypothetical protein